MRLCNQLAAALAAGALYRTKVEYSTARNKTLERHAMSWLYEMRRFTDQQSLSGVARIVRRGVARQAVSHGLELCPSHGAKKMFGILNSNPWLTSLLAHHVVPRGQSLLGNFRLRNWASQTESSVIGGQSSRFIRDISIDIGDLIGSFGNRPPASIAALRKAIVVFITRTIEETVTPPHSASSITPPSDYNMLSKLMREKVEKTAGLVRNDVSFITFNYDTCLEFGLVRRSLGVDYCLGEPFIDPAEERLSTAPARAEAARLDQLGSLPQVQQDHPNGNRAFMKCHHDRPDGYARCST